jgi:hypothetical protein
MLHPFIAITTDLSFVSCHLSVAPSSLGALAPLREAEHVVVRAQRRQGAKKKDAKKKPIVHFSRSNDQ